MELRDVEIFLTLAEELHFGRTAERLHVSQARVSQAITEGRVLAVPVGHELAGRASVSMEDFADRVFVDPGQHLPASWVEAMLPRTTPAGRPVPRGAQAGTFHEVLTMVASGEGLMPLNEHVRRHYSPPEVVFVPVHDAPTTEWALVWHGDDLPPRVRGFVDVSTELGPRPVGRAGDARP